MAKSHVWDNATDNVPSSESITQGDIPAYRVCKRYTKSSTVNARHIEHSLGISKAQRLRRNKVSLASSRKSAASELPSKNLRASQRLQQKQKSKHFVIANNTLQLHKHSRNNGPDPSDLSSFLPVHRTHQHHGRRILCMVPTPLLPRPDTSPFSTRILWGPHWN